jgi:tetratricopeptide (TPR) repeat protein
MKRQNIIRLASFFVVISLALWGCAKDSSDDVPSTYSSNSGMLDEGWSAYSSGDYETALELFQDVGRRDALSTNAYLGQGWSSLRLEGYIDARTAFGVVLNLATNEGDNISIADGWAGLFLIELQERYNLETDPDEDPTDDDLSAAAEEALEAGEAVLTYAAAYTTTHDAEFDYLEVHKALAQTYLYLHRYEEALEHTVEYLESTVNGLLAGGSFTVESATSTLVPYADANGNLQLFTVDADDGTLTSADLAAGVITLEFLTDFNGDSTTDILDEISSYLYEDNLLYFADDYDYPTATESLPVYKVSHAQPGEPASVYFVVQTSNHGVYNVSSAIWTTQGDSVTWFIVDTTQVPIDTSLADGVYEPDTCCYFFSDTMMIDVGYDVSGAVWTSLDPSTGVPVDPDATLDGPDSSQLAYDYDLIKVADNAVGDTIAVTYSYGKFSLSYQQTDDFVSYLAYLNSKLSVGSSRFLVER